MKALQFVPRRESHRCLDCPHPMSAVSPQALATAFQDHVDYVNAVLDRDTDPHFTLQRLDALAHA